MIMKDFITAKQEFDKLVEESLKKYKPKVPVVFTKLSEVTKAITSNMITWSRKNSLWPLQFGLACCAMELLDFGASRIDAERKGFLVFRATPRQSDVMISAGWITKSMAPEVKRLYEQMSRPRYVVAYGECSVSGGPWYESYNIIEGIDQIVPVDVYVSGCPPRPESLFDALLKLQEKVGGKIDN